MEINGWSCQHAPHKCSYVRVEMLFVRVTNGARAQCTCVRFSVFHTSDGQNLFSQQFDSTLVGSSDVASARLTICAFVRSTLVLTPESSSGYVHTAVAAAAPV